MRNRIDLLGGLGAGEDENRKGQVGTGEGWTERVLGERTTFGRLCGNLVQ